MPKSKTSAPEIVPDSIPGEPVADDPVFPRLEPMSAGDVRAITRLMSPPDDEPVPLRVRVVTNIRQNGERGAVLYGRRGLYFGDDAAFLWANHRDCVEPFTE